MLPKTIRTTRLCGLLLTIVFSSTAIAQSSAAIETALANKNLLLAGQLLQQRIAGFTAAKNADSLGTCIQYVGKIEKEKAGVDAAVKKVDAFANSIFTLKPAVPAIVQVYLDAGEFYGSVGKNNLAYAANQKAFAVGKPHFQTATARLGVVQSNLGTYAQRLGNIGESEAHHRLALHYLSADPKAEWESRYINFNNLGSIHYYHSQHDSALFYFEKAVAALQKTEAKPVNHYYRPAVVQNNIAGIYSLQGKATKAIGAMQSCIANLKKFLATKEPHPKKTSALTFQLEATDNLAGIYKELGDYKKAHELLQYAYAQKRERLGDGDPALFISQILIGQLQYAVKNFDSAQLYLNQGLTNISTADGDYLFWQADACNTLALLYDERKDVGKATFFYAKADSLYSASLQGDYDNIYLEFISNEALFHAQQGRSAIAMAKAKKAYDYAVGNSGAQSLLASNQLLGLAEVSFEAGQPAQALTYSNQALAVVDGLTKASSDLLDSIRTELKKPKIILQKTKAQYALLKKKDATTLTPLLNELNAAMTLLERRKSILTDAQDISLLMADQADLIAFIKKLNLELYKTSKDQGRLENLLQLHESSIYSRIRARLDKTDNIRFARLPAGTAEKERSLKAAITASLQGAGTHDEKMQAYMKATDDWTAFREGLRKTAPDYFAMRYASIIKPTEGILAALPEKTTVVRYFFVEKELLALVADKGSRQLFSLGEADLQPAVEKLSTFTLTTVDAGKTLADLYSRLWAPLQKAVRQPSVVIIPDGILYNLSFELLTPQPITAFTELASKSLLATHAISYNYSLFNLERKKASAGPTSFIAFAPGFSDDLKQRYRKSTDSTVVDEGYFSLLPQPTAVSLATSAHDNFGGSLFVNEASTRTAFQQHAGGHSIIHIGTHAEAANLYPEYSRLIFAAEPQGNHSLYLPQLYNCDLTSQLTVLTACESGRPGYQDGEGMISLAHAFNYAGSQSIITGLWKLDEQATAAVMEHFYRNLEGGMAKDEALRQAKLHYLQTADGRTLAPAYWAGLVVMGDTSPVEMKKNKVATGWWIGGGIAILFLTAVILATRKQMVRKTHFTKELHKAN